MWEMETGLKAQRKVCFGVFLLHSRTSPNVNSMAHFGFCVSNRDTEHSDLTSHFYLAHLIVSTSTDWPDY